MFLIEQRSTGDVTILELNGRLTLGEGSELLKTTVGSLLKAGKKNILVNMAGVSYVDSVGNGAMDHIYISIRRGEGNLRLSNLVRRVRDLYEITKRYAYLDIFDSEDDAIMSFKFPAKHCICPGCGGLTRPALFYQEFWPPQRCYTCDLRFILVRSHTSPEEVQIESVRIGTHYGEYFEIFSGQPFTIQVVGRLDLFSSAALKKAWQMLPSPRRVMVDRSTCKRLLR